MREVSFFHMETGVLHDSHLMASSDKLVEINTPKNHVAIDGHHDHLSKRVDIASGEVIEYQPAQPSSDHEWDDETKRWKLSALAAGKIDRSNAARARIAQLESAQHRHVREHVLGSARAADELRKIHDEIASLEQAL